MNSKFILSLICAGFVVLTSVNFSTAAGGSFLHQVPILNTQQISGLSDQELIDNYIETIVELEATRTFYLASGFTPKEYDSFKDILRYRILLMREMEKRQIAVPAFEMPVKY